MIIFWVVILFDCKEPIEDAHAVEDFLSLDITDSTTLVDYLASFSQKKKRIILDITFLLQSLEWGTWEITSDHNCATDCRHIIETIYDFQLIFISKDKTTTNSGQIVTI